LATTTVFFCGEGEGDAYLWLTSDFSTFFLILLTALLNSSFFTLLYLMIYLGVDLIWTGVTIFF